MQGLHRQQGGTAWAQQTHHTQPTGTAPQLLIKHCSNTDQTLVKDTVITPPSLPPSLSCPHVPYPPAGQSQRSLSPFGQTHNRPPAHCHQWCHQPARYNTAAQHSSTVRQQWHSVPRHKIVKTAAPCCSCTPHATNVSPHVAHHPDFPLQPHTRLAHLSPPLSTPHAPL